MSEVEITTYTRSQLIRIHRIPITKTRKFLLHVLNHGKYRYDVPEFIECYLKDVDTEPKLVLCFQNRNIHETDEDAYKMLLYVLNLHPLILDEECDTDDDNKELILVFRFPTEYLKDLRIFLNGNYSQLSQKFKENMLKMGFYKKDAVLTGKKLDGLPLVSIHEVLNPTEKRIKEIENSLNLDISLPKGEILSIPNLDLEVYKPINQFKESYEKN